jgi:uncharacterized protein (TIGR00255 family)
MRSMTGFGAGTAERKDFAVRIELRTVNHRHILIKSRLPADLAHLEQAVETQIKKRLERGSVTANVQLLRGLGGPAFEIDEEVARRYHKAARRLAAKLDLKSELTARDLLALPGVLAPSLNARSAAAEERVVREALDQALDALVAMREKEGSSLAKDLAGHSREMQKSRASIAKAMPRVVRRHQEALRKRVAELLARPGGGASPLPENEVAREVALLADRLDVSEELARLESHIAQLEKLLTGAGAVGRKLDFLSQELFREANTIGAKCNDAKVAHSVVDLKTHIERVREQVQNIE